jgi:hypothetical protein
MTPPAKIGTQFTSTSHQMSDKRKAYPVYSMTT